MVVQHNIAAINSNGQLGITTKVKAKSSEKLSSGYRINRAADDAAGLAISEKMRRQIRGLTQASENLQDGVSLAQVADGALNEVHDMLHRVNELSVKAANGTLSSVDRKYINQEVQALKREMNRVFKTTKFNEVEIFKTVDIIYNPEITDYPTDMGIFHKGNGGIGGLEFENVFLLGFEENVFPSYRCVDDEAEMEEERKKIEEERARSQKMMEELQALKAQLNARQGTQDPSAPSPSAPDGNDNEEK